MQLDDGRRANVLMTERTHGNLGTRQDLGVVDALRRDVVDAPWSWFNQVHGRTVFLVEAPGHGAGTTADGACTAASNAPIAVQVADCAPVAFIDSGGLIGVAHAGWRGLVAGILQSTVEAMSLIGARSPKAIIGPCIGPGAYEFGSDDLDRVAEVLGDSVRSVTTGGEPALDVGAAVRSVLAGLGIEVVCHLGGCTAGDATRWWSHRARADVQRQALVAWIDTP